MVLLQFTCWLEVMSLSRAFSPYVAWMCMIRPWIARAMGMINST